MQEDRIIVKEQVLQRDMYYKEQLVLSYTVKYPQFISDMFRGFLKELNLYYKMNALRYVHFNIGRLYRLAVEEYENSVANDFPVRAYEVLTDYTVTYNRNCTLSLYFDRYEYTGGAHGNTVRSSDTWNLQAEREMELGDLFSDGNYREYVIRQILEQIEADISAGNDYYFDNYNDLVNEYFNIRNFYLDGEGIVIYFQQYEIAPYASGIRTFTIPYQQKVYCYCSQPVYATCFL